MTGDILLLEISLSTDADCYTKYNDKLVIVEQELHASGYCTSMTEVEAIISKVESYLRSVEYEQYSQKDYALECMLEVRNQALEYITTEFPRQVSEYEFGRLVAFSYIGGNQYFKLRLTHVEPISDNFITI